MVRGLIWIGNVPWHFDSHSSLQKIATYSSVSPSTVGHKSPISHVEGAQPPKSGGLFMSGGTTMPSEY